LGFRGCFDAQILRLPTETHPARPDGSAYDAVVSGIRRADDLVGFTKEQASPWRAGEADDLAIHDQNTVSMAIVSADAQIHALAARALAHVLADAASASPPAHPA
jgi:hypothetical protein